ncbi:MAG: O-antigen ligase family protein [Bacteroidetes bacterium]|nr:O-antigen ligase family protein [Bacteroidota bacterium]
MQLESNDQVSSDDYASHVQSIGNISSDDSNIERLNRWACALRMFQDRPVLGFGPGTYMFKYGSYQKFSERSGISTNFAEGGGSHSEYLGPLIRAGLYGSFDHFSIDRCHRANHRQLH